MDPILGSIALFGFGFVPQGWAACDGSMLAISQNSALFTLLGTTYGGNGTTTFALPNLQGRVPIGQGQGQSPHTIGEMGGNETVTLTTDQMPVHNHALAGSGNAATGSTLNGNVLGISNGITSQGEDPVTVNVYAPAGNPVTADPTAIGLTGGSQGHPNMQPYLCLNYCIAVVGIFPSRN